MADIRAHRDRLLGLLPRIYTAQPDDSAVGVLLGAMAAALANFDRDLTRALHDRWVVLAGGEAVAGGASAIERLGALIGLPRLGADQDRPQDHENAEAYRRRLRIAARILTTGLATPRAILSLALATLGADPCPLLQQKRDPGRSPDITRAWGVAHGRRGGCAVCRGGTVPAVSMSRLAATPGCPLRIEAIVEAVLAENPPTPCSTQARLRIGRSMPIDNASLIADRPVVTMGAPLVAIPYPALQNRETGQTMLYAGVLRKGETLTVLPAMIAAETGPFATDAGNAEHAWLGIHPDGQAIVTGPDGRQRDVGGSIFYIWGARFDDPDTVFGGPGGNGTSFAVLGGGIRTPQLRPGRDEWRALSFGNPESTFDDDTSRFAAPDAERGTSFAKIDVAAASLDPVRAKALLDEIGRAETADATPDEILDIGLSWVARPPATFRLSIPRSEAVDAAERRGAVAALRDIIDLARAAGIQALIDLPRPLPSEANRLADSIPAVAARIAGREIAMRRIAIYETGRSGALLSLSVARTEQVANNPGEHGIGVAGVFDATPLDLSLLV
jgi:hypothetical protein